MAMRATPPTAEPAAPPVASRPAFSLKPSKQTAIILGVMIGTCLLAAVGIAFWQQSQVADLDKEITAKSQQLSDNQKIAKRLDSVEADYAATVARINGLETAKSPTEYFPTLLKQIEQLAKDTNLRVDSTSSVFQPAPPPPTDKAALKTYTPQPYDKDAIRMGVRGRYWDIYNFLDRITRFPKILSVDKIDFHPEMAAPDKSPILIINLEMTGYLFKQDTPLPEPSPDQKKGVEMPNVPTAMPTLPPRPTI